MSCFDKEDYKRIKRELKAAKVNIKFFVSEGGSDNGFVAVYSARPGMRMVEVAVSYCSPEDKFKKKHGKYQALCKLYDRQVVQLPLGEFADVEAYMTETLARMFDV